MHDTQDPTRGKAPKSSDQLGRGNTISLQELFRGQAGFGPRGKPNSAYDDEGEEGSEDGGL